MATTEKYYVYDANNPSKVLFPFPFEYITKDDVKVSINDVETTEYTYANDTTIQLNSALTQGQELRIYRYTAIDDLKATFASGSSIRAKDLNDNFQQNNFAVQEIRNYSWDNETETVHSNETWVGSDTQIATTAAMDARFWDQDGDVTQSTENFEDTDDKIMTAAAIDDRIDFAITNDIDSDGTGITVDASANDGTITLGLADNSIDFSKIKNDDIITYAEQEAASVNPADSNIFTANAAARRFDALVQTSAPTGSTWQTGKLWYQNDEDQTVYMWDGNSWEAITSGGSFTRLDQVIYVDSVNGNDNNNGHRISSPKRTIRAAIADINADATHGDGSTVVVAPGVYGEEFPIDIQRNDVSIVGTSLRNCIIHPAIPEADQAGYAVNVPEANELQTMFRVNSGTYIANLTLMGMKASGARGGNALDTDTTYGLPTNQGWNFAFFPGAIIRKSPYIQNCTNFSDSRINNVDFNPHTQTEGAAGDLTSDPSGGGILINGSTPANNSPLRSMVCDSYTHTALDGPGIFVTNNGYCQATSSYSFFNHYHLKCLNGGQANLAASTTDFGRFSLIADGRSTTHIFTATVDGTFNAGEASFNIDNLVDNWFGTATRPQDNMLVEIGTDVYPITSATVNGNGWTVNIIRPDPADRTANLGLINGLTNATPVRFYLRSMIASSGHTMEYVGSGTDYDALPQNGGVPVDANQLTELNDGKIWAATTDHKGTFRVGGTFEVDQETGFVNIPAGALSVSRLLAELDVNGQEIVSNEPNQDIVLNPNGTGVVNVSTSRITNVVDPTDAQDAATRNYVDTFVNQTANIGDLQVTGAKIADDTIDSSKLTAATVVTDSEHAGATTNDTSFFTTSASDSRYFRQDSSETITSGAAWSSSNNFVATTAAIDARIVDLVEEVGGFVPIDDENSFPAENPDINNGAGTLISIKAMSTTRTPSSGTVTIANGSGSNTVTITDCGTNDLGAGQGVIVETTATLHTYKFHRLTPFATQVTTVANNTANINTVATNIGDINTLADNIGDIQTLEDNIGDIQTLENNITDINTVAANIGDIQTLEDNIGDIQTLEDNIGDIQTLENNIADINTVAGSITNVNNFANVYQINNGDPTTRPDSSALVEGDLVYRTDTDVIRAYNGTSYQDISPDAATLADIAIVADDLASFEDLGSIADALTAAQSGGALETCADNIADIRTLADIEDGTDATDAIQTVAGIASDVTTVAARDTEISRLGTTDTVADMAILGTTDAVADMAILGTTDVVADMNTLATTANVANMDTCADDISNINTVAGSISNVNTTAGSISNVNTVASNISDVTTVANDLNEATSEIETVATDIANVNTVGNAITNVNTVAGQISPTNNVGTVAGISSNVSTVAGISSDVTTVAGKATEVETVADNISNVNTTAGSISNVNTVAGAITNVNTVATNISDVNNFADLYTISGTQPSSPNNGDLWYDSVNDVLKFWNGSSWDAISSGGIQNLVEDLTPQLGGTLDGQNNNLSNIGTIDGTNLQIDFGTI